ncbi:SLC13 family permease [Limnochorda pilosa]|uniref:SLC13 family permease n=1 Tax=Limnochorda pilosa TaxID=1555112 RepID=UPI00082FF925|nr:SLC13 family permease [Limnochorda pilosa]
MSDQNPAQVVGRPVASRVDGVPRPSVTFEEGAGDAQVQSPARPLRARLKPVLAAAGLGAALVILLLPTPEGLTLEGQRAVVAFVAAVTLWVTNLLPAPVTGLLGMALVPLLGALPAERAFALFGNKAVFFILGALMLSAGLQRTGLGDRMTLGLLRRNVAAMATVLPLAYSWGAVLGVNPVLTTLVTALAGGLAFMFPMGTPPNAIAYPSGYYSVADSVRAGVLLSLMALGIFLLVALTYWPVAGIR